MKQVTINIPDKKYPLFIKLIKGLDYVTVAKGEKHKKDNKEHPVFTSIKQGLKEVELAKSGKLKSRPLKDFLDEV